MNDRRPLRNEAPEPRRTRLRLTTSTSVGEQMRAELRLLDAIDLLHRFNVEVQTQAELANPAPHRRRVLGILMA